jgi:hypothetical protein
MTKDPVSVSLSSTLQDALLLIEKSEGRGLSGGG